MSTGEPILCVRPVFIGWIALAVQLPLQLFFTLWAGLFFGGIITSFGVFAHGSQAPYILFGAIAFFGIPAVAYVGKKLNYSRTEYRFYSDRLEFEEGFFSINKKVIRYHDIREVTLHKGIFQRPYGLGTIYLATLATGYRASFNPFVTLGFGNVSASGVNVRDIPGPDPVFEKISGLIDARRD